jgi:hypothetical protein
MVQEKYIGIENELTSFSLKYGNSQGFNSNNFQNLLIDKYYQISNNAIRSNIGNGYYIDGSEIEITTPPIALNKGFATRLTNALVLGRNYIIKNTPELQHTGYSMHWNLSHDDSNFELGTNKYSLIHHLYIPFQLFGLTPVSCGFNVRTSKSDNRYEVIGDSLINVDQINATALLLGAYSAATETKSFKKEMIPIEISDITKYKYHSEYAPITNMLKKGRYSEINIKYNNIIKLTQAQNILELFYDWLSPFVYKLGEKDEINNLEAFIKGEKKLEMDNLKYFKKLEQEGGIKRKIYMPLEIKTNNGLKSQVLKIVNEDKIEVPIEGKLLGIYALNTNSNDHFQTTLMSWDYIAIEVLLKKKITKINLSKLKLTEDIIVKYTEQLLGVNDIYDFANQYKKVYGLSELNQSKEYSSSLDTMDVKIKEIATPAIKRRLKKRIRYNPNKDLSL